MPPSFNNMNELVGYLNTLENRVRDLEARNAALQRDLSLVSVDPAKALPKTGLVSDKFLQRAFTVWGHYFVAQLIISVPLFLIQLIFIYSYFFLFAPQSNGFPLF
jgi:hypothetical protein